MYAYRRYILLAWVIFAATCIVGYFTQPEIFAPKAVADWLRGYGRLAFVVFFLISTFRGFTLLPSTFTVLAGAYLFPEYPFSVLLLSVIAVVLSSSLVYYFSEWLGVDTYFEEKYPTKIAWLHRAIDERGMYIVVGWALFPALPTDLVCYVAGVLRMQYWKFAVAIALGEAPIMALYVFLGKHI